MSSYLTFFKKRRVRFFDCAQEDKAGRRYNAKRVCLTQNADTPFIIHIKITGKFWLFGLHGLDKLLKIVCREANGGIVAKEEGD